MRCLALASELDMQGYTIAFLSRVMPATLSKVFKEANIHLYLLSYDIKLDEQPYLLTNYELVDANETLALVKKLNPLWIVTDSYGISDLWEKKVRALNTHLLAVDDLANRPHDCDLLLDQNYLPNMQKRYQSLLPRSTQCLLGANFVLLRSVFYSERKTLLPYCRRFNDKKITVCFGGSDASNETQKALIALLCVCDESYFITIIVGSLYKHLDDLYNLISSHNNVQIIQQVNNIETYLSTSFLAIGAIGTMTWERCCMGTPSIVASIADNQLEVSNYLSEKKYHTYVGHCSITSVNVYRTVLASLIDNYEYLFNQHQLVSQLVDGLGVQRVVERMKKISGEK